LLYIDKAIKILAKNKGYSPMYKIIVTWHGGPKWDPEQPSMFNPIKPKSPFEHLFELGYSTLDDVVLYYGQFKDKPITIEQKQDKDNPDINWITEFNIESTDKQEADMLKDAICGLYETKIKQLQSKSSPFAVDIETKLLA
jgi:hypothetical protein